MKVFRRDANITLHWLSKTKKRALFYRLSFGTPKGEFLTACRTNNNFDPDMVCSATYARGSVIWRFSAPQSEPCLLRCSMRLYRVHFTS